MADRLTGDAKQQAQSMLSEARTEADKTLDSATSTSAGLPVHNRERISTTAPSSRAISTARARCSLALETSC